MNREFEKVRKEKVRQEMGRRASILQDGGGWDNGGRDVRLS